MINTKLFASDVLARVTKKNKDFRTTVEEKTAELYKITWTQKSRKCPSNLSGNSPENVEKSHFYLKKPRHFSLKSRSISKIIWK